MASNQIINFANGDKFWYMNDQRHRVDGPAIEYANGDKYWYMYGKLHRTDGPAIENADGTKEWYLNDRELTYTEWLFWAQVDVDKYE